MKIRTDFVTNSSSSSFVTIHITSRKVAEYLESRREEWENEEDWNPIEVDIDGDNIEINGGDRDACFEEPPSCLAEAMERILEVIGLEPEGDESKLCASIEKMSWDATTEGIDGDDGSLDRKNYEADALQVMLEEVAENNDCTPEEVTDEMFVSYVTIEPDTVVEHGTFEYDRKNGKSKYFYTNRMRIRKKETDETKQ